MTNPPTSSPVNSPHGLAAAPFAALLLAALAMATSPVFVRLAALGPFTSAFWRVAAALPALWLWATWEARQRGEPAGSAFRISRAGLVAGLVFAGDLLVWHLAILKTTVANASFLALMTPVWVVLGSRLLIGESVGRGAVYGLLLCLAGAGALLGSSMTFAPGHLTGDLFAIATSIFFAAYFMAIRVARRETRTGRIVFQTSLISAIALFVVAFTAENRLFPASSAGFAAALSLAYFSHAGGQGALAYALGHLPVAFSSLVSYLGALIAAGLAWLVFAEALSPLQFAGGALIIGGIYVARPTAGRP